MDKTEYGHELHNGCAGKLTELRIAVDLIKRGWQLFEAMSPSAPCDLIGVTRTGKVVRIECTVAHLGRLPATPPYFTPHNPKNYDLICGVLKDNGELVYERDPESFDI